MSEPDLLQLAGVQDDAKEQTMTEQELKAKLDIFEELFKKGCYFCSRIVADELYDADVGFASRVCSRAYPHYPRILREKSKEDIGRVNNMFMKYHFSYWSFSSDNNKRQKTIDIKKTMCHPH